MFPKGWLWACWPLRPEVPFLKEWGPFWLSPLVSASRTSPRARLSPSPLFAAGGTRKKSFLLGVLSGAVEPAGALLVVCFQDFVVALLPWFLSFSAGAMLYVVVEELIPESHAMAGGESDWATVSVLVGFLVMMVLDVALG